MSKVISIDLELNQPSGKIIQIGYVIGTIFQTKILAERSLIVNPEEKLGSIQNGMTMTEFTGITQEQVDSGYTLKEAYEIMCSDIKKFNPTTTPVQWGQGDARALRIELNMTHDEFVFRSRDFDVKTIYQTYRLFNNKSVASGLEAAMRSLGMEFQGRPHDALADAKNTYYTFMNLGNRLVLSDKINKLLF